MWTCKELKQSAKKVLYNSYGASLGVIFLSCLINVVVSSVVFCLCSLLFVGALTEDSVGIALLASFTPITMTVVMNIFLGNPLSVGVLKFFIHASQNDVSIRHLGYGFSKNYINIVKTLFLRDLFIILWGSLLIIPGYVKSYEYFFIPFYLAEDSAIGWREAFQRSKRATCGQKAHIFLLELSFIGWYLLVTVLFVICTVAARSVAPFVLAILFLLLSPYFYATTVQLYAVLGNPLSKDC